MSEPLRRLYGGPPWVRACVALIAVAGCAVGPNYKAPQPPAQLHYTRSDPQQIAAEGAPAQRMRSDIAMPSLWWQAFGSSELDAMIDMALKGSPTLKSALATLEQARSLLSAARGAAYPVLDFAISAERSTAFGTTRGNADNQYTLGPNLSFTPDIFGGTRRRIEQAQAQLAYEQAQWEGARLSLIGNIVLQAIALASALEQVAAVKDIVSVDERNLELVAVSTSAGKTAQLDVLTAESQLAADQALLPPLLQQASIARHALTVLAGKASSDWSPPEFDFRMLHLPRDLPLSLPSDLVRCRPDLLGAEAQLQAATAAIGIASVQLYPSVTLNASWATVGDTPGKLFGGTSYWSIASTMLAPVFNGHTLAAQRDAATHAYAAQLENYAQAVLQAFSQVADVLEALEHDSILLSDESKALQTARSTLDLTQQSYEAGQASLLQLLVAQRLYLEARLGLARASSQQYTDSAQFFVAMGGARPDVTANDSVTLAPEPDHGEGAGKHD